jgi:site-specific recombinase XerD
MTHLSAVPEPSLAGPGEGSEPADWEDLRASFVLDLRTAHRSPRTVDTYLAGGDAFARFLAQRSPGRLIEQTRRDDLRAFLVGLADQGRKANSIATRHRALRALFKFMVREEVITTSPMDAIPSPTITDERVPPALTPEQVEQMVGVCAPKSTFLGARDRALILLIASAGIRASECIGLTEEHLHLDSDEPYVVVHGKGGRDREAACSYAAAKAVMAYLRQRRKRPDAHRSELWLGRTGRPLTTKGLLALVTEAGKRVGLDVHTHALRHTATDWMLSRGMQEHDVATQLGHKGLKQLARYGRARAVERSRSAFFRT